jgi:hypothetical protein
MFNCKLIRKVERHKTETLLAERRTKDAIFSDVYVLANISKKYDRCK